MQQKNALKIITLYDLIANNIFIIFATLHHIIIMLFNHNSIHHLNKLIVDFPEQHNRFETIQLNLQVCQSITIFTAFIIYFITGNKHKSLLRITVMFSSCFIKISYTVIQIYNFDRKTIENNVDYDFGTYYKIIEVSYITRFAIIFIVIIGIISYVSIKPLAEHVKYGIDLAKKYKIKYIEHTTVSKLENV
jgi:hypothetical protein